jgi:lysophospholipase L1-like esterase
MKRFALAVSCALLAGACASSTSPTPPPPTEDPPKISCPASQTIQLTTGTSIAVTFPSPTFTNGKPPVTTSCTIQSGTTFNVGTTTVSCTATDALQRPDVCAFTVTVQAPPRLTVTRFLAFGDSITAGEDGVDGGPDTSPLCQTQTTSSASIQPRVILPDAQTYPGQLQTKLSAQYQTQSPTVVKRGCPGEAVSGMNTMKTRQRFDTLVSTGQYDVVLIMEGSNDLDNAASGDPAAPPDPVGSAASALRNLVDDAKSVGVRPLLATIPPMSAAGRRGAGAGLVTSLNDRIFQIGSAENMTIVDVYTAFNGNLSLIGDDGLHPNPSGYSVIAEAFFAASKSAFEVKTAAPVLSFRRR